MSDPFEARERSFYITGEVTDFDVAAIQDYLGKVGMQIIEKPLPVSRPDALNVLELEFAAATDVFRREEFLKYWPYKSRGVRVWTHLIESIRENEMPLDLRRTDFQDLGITYESAAAFLESLALGEYEGKEPTENARKCLQGVVRNWRTAQKQEATS